MGRRKVDAMAADEQSTPEAPGDTEPVLAAEHVSVDRGGTRVLSDVSMAVPPEARMLIRGPSGAGKTTLFRVLGLLEPPTEGRVLVRGTDAASLPERRRAALRRDHVGIVFQDFQLVPDLTARENVALPQQHGGGRDEEWLDDLFARLDIVDLAGQYPASLSGGEKQRVAIARALANRPAVVLADEPTGQLDPDTAGRVLDLLDEATQETALVVVSHDRGLGERFERRVLLRDGRVVESEGG
jgi:ABC-type lipoprotein export system ATPase subunit